MNTSEKNNEPALRDDHGSAHRHGHALHHHGPASGRRLGAVILLNMAITAAEYVGGVLSGSLALLSDAGHNFSDVLSLLLGYGGEKISRRKGGRGFSFGLKRVEVASALINALALVGIGVYIVVEAIGRFEDPRPISVGIMLPVAAVGLFGNVASIMLLSGERKSSINMKSAFLHLFYDAVSSVAVILAGVALYFTGMVWIDLAISLAIAVMIVGGSTGIIREAARIFLQGAPSHIDVEEVHRAIQGIPGVEEIHGLHIWSISSREVFLSCHVLARGGDGSRDSDDIIREINSLLDERFGITHTTIQVEREMLCGPDGLECCR